MSQEKKLCIYLSTYHIQWLKEGQSHATSAKYIKWSNEFVEWSELKNQIAIGEFNSTAWTIDTGTFIPTTRDLNGIYT